MGVASPGAESTQRTDVDNPTLRGTEVRKSFSRNEKWAAGVGFECGIPLVERKAFESRGAEDCRVVDEDVETAELGDDGGDSGANGRLGAHIAVKGSSLAPDAGNIGGGLGGFDLRSSVGDGYIGAGIGEGERDRAADAAGSASDKCGFAGERKC